MAITSSINPLIPLSIKPVDMAQVYTTQANVEMAQARNKLYDLQAQMAEQQLERLQNPSFSEQQMEMVKDGVLLAQRFRQMGLGEGVTPDTPQWQGAMSWVASELENYANNGREPPQMLVESMKLLQSGDPARVSNAVNEFLQAGQQYGWIQAEPEPRKREKVQGADGYWYWTDTQERVLPNVVGPDKPSELEKFEFEQGREERIADQLSSNMEKAQIESTEMAFKASNNAQEMWIIAQQYENNPNFRSGAAADWAENLKSVFGTEDAVTQIRKRYAAVINSQVVNNLPPGVASDKDIELAREGFLSPNANPSVVAGFLRGLAKMEALNSEFHKFRADYIDENRGLGGFLDAWRQYAKTFDAEFNFPGQSGGPVQIENDEQFRQLPPGTEFIGPDGQLRRKP